MFLVNRELLNRTMTENGLFNNMIVNTLAPVLKCSIPALAVRISSMRNGKNISAEGDFLNMVENVIGLKKDELKGDPITKSEVQNINRRNKFTISKVKPELSRLVRSKPGSKDVLVSKEFLKSILAII